MALKDDIEEANDSLDIGHRAHLTDAGEVARKAAAAATSFLDGAAKPVTTKSERKRAFTILPPLSRQLGLSEIETTGIFSVSAAIWVVTSAFWGKLSDRWGRKPIMLM